jgi:hypothetical protein
MQTDTDKLEYLSRRLTAWDQDLRWGHRAYTHETNSRAVELLAAARL